MGCWRHVATMLAVDVAFAVMNSMVKMAFNDGMHSLVFITLRLLAATLFLGPIAFFRERKTRPKLTSEIFVYLFFSALVGASLTQYLFFLGLQHTSATFACAFLNMTPMFTFLLALPFRMERVNLKSKAGLAKVVGTLVGLGGAILLTLYQGAPLTRFPPGPTLSGTRHGPTEGPSAKRWVTGSLALLAGSASYSSWFLLQSKVGKKYPALYSGTSIMFFLAFLQAAALGLATEKTFAVWVLRSKLQIITVVFAGVVGSGLGFLGMAWCVEQRGPVFTAAFTPLVQILVAAIDFSVLHEQLFVGSVLGSAFVIMGLYFLLWGKNKEASNPPSKAVEGQSVELPVQIQTI